ncbi:DNA replication regulator SLD3-domain-containing protein [Stachybotrys elegans]|uniref:DNA replication regulator SLD3-domain-containing protein n=1 Tax=Stachybotrys elegans TaxID=80388 RepID=A0A8K0WWL3_9HYPO|nr:DNA replication regulator SLD3-domain-containing protein [Stachybotrys elegans]
MSTSVPVDADASRPRSGILTPSSEASLNRHDGVSSPNARDAKPASTTPMDYLLKQSIAIRPHPPNLHVQPRVLQPLMLLPRKHLSLSCIDFAASQNELSPSRFVESHIKILDLESRVGTSSSILIARYDSKGAIYAIERHGEGLYVVCRVGSWVSLESLSSHATAVCRERLRPKRTELQELASCNATTTPQLHNEQKKKRAAIEAIQSLVKKRARSQSVSVLHDIPPVEEAKKPKLESAHPSPLPSSETGLEAVVKSRETQDPLPASIEKADDVSPQQTAQSIFDSIRTQYFEALYKSMGSLAYFAKGPLSRARSAFHLDLEADLDMADLIDFLKSLVLTTVQIDQKYRQSIPETISKSSHMLDSSDEGRKKKRKTKKMKLGKDSLYPHEDEAIKAWWNATKPELADEDAPISEEQIKSHVSLLRTRETQLQMIIIFEILALEPLKAAEDTGNTDLPALPGAADSQDTQVTAPPRKRNKHNLPVLLEVHADRLTIWQSIATDEQLSLGDSQLMGQTADGQTQQKASSEPLKDFCVDVIVPFFSARLPVLCDSISRKLGGPVIVAPPKAAKTVKRQSSKREQKPGAVAKRPALPNAPRTLQRALSTEQQHRRSVSRGPSNMIALMRSATSTSIAIKREGGDSTPGTLAQKGLDETLGQRLGSLSRSHSMTTLEDAKAKKKALVEAELKDAISALRKPNRDVVGKALAETAQRQAATTMSSKKSRKPVRGGSSAIVKATPTNVRFRDVLSTKQESFAEANQWSIEETIPPSSIGTLVPSTTQRRSHVDALPVLGSPTLEAIGETPIRASTTSRIYRQTRDEDLAIPPSPIAGQDAAALDYFPDLESPTRPVRKLDFSASATDRICETPFKASASRAPVLEKHGHEQGKETKKTIYQQLGWDDDLDDLL